MSARIDQILASRKVIVTCGTGGVGKTTLSSALALRAALNGRRAVVITIDPAKRLATSLGLQSLSDDPADLTDNARDRWAAVASRHGSTRKFEGTIAALMPDTRRTFEAFVADLSPKKETAEAVFRNPLFNTFSREFSGTNDYMALEKLLLLHRDQRFDCIILDTPPSRNTMAFLHAPQLLAQLFEERIIRWFLMPANQILQFGMRKALGALERLTGSDFMSHLIQFASALFEVRVKFLANLDQILGLLRSRDTGFVLVAGPHPDLIPEARQFIAHLQANSFNFDGVALNRSLSYLQGPGGLERITHAPSREIVQNLLLRESRVIDDLRQARIETAIQLPELARDIHRIDDLFEIALAMEADRFSIPKV